MQHGLSVVALVSFVLTVFLQPETSQPGARGVDAVRARGEKVGFVVLNPFSSLTVLRSPNVMLVVSASVFLLSGSSGFMADPMTYQRL